MSTKVEWTPHLRGTTVHPLSHGKPALVVGHGIRLADGWPEAFGPSDTIQMFGRTVTAAFCAGFYGRDLTGAERELVAEYLRRWREGPQMDS